MTVYTIFFTPSGHYFFGTDPTVSPFGCGANGGAPGTCVPNTGVSNLVHNNYYTLKLTTILSNRLVNEARVSLQRTTLAAILSPTVPNNELTQFGITPNEPTLTSLIEMAITGGFTFGGTTFYPDSKASSDWEAADEISWTLGKHTIRIGGEIERDRYNWDLTGLPQGILTFNTIQDFLLGLPGCSPAAIQAGCSAANPGNTNGTALSNIASNGTLAAVTRPGGHWNSFREPFGDLFVQDDFKIKPQFTLNLGLRWEYIAQSYDQYGYLGSIWPNLINTVPIPGPSAATGTLAGFVVPANFNYQANPAPPVGGAYQNSQKTGTGTPAPLTDFAPRAGFAYSPLASNRLVVRGGAGYFYDRISIGQNDTSAVQAEPYTTNDFGSSSAIYYATLAQPYAPTPLSWTPRWINFANNTYSSIGAYGLEQDFRTPLVYEWNLGTQYEFVSHWIFELSYVGSRGIHLVAQRQINEAQLVGNPLGNNTLTAPAIAAGLVTTNTVANAFERVPYLGFQPLGINFTQDDGDAKYNSIEATVRKQFSHGFQAVVAYAYARGFNTYNTGYAYDNPNINVYGLNAFYHPQRLSVNYLWNLPLGNHEGWLGKVMNGWGLSGVTIVQDGTPLTVTDTRGGTIYGFGAGAVSSTAEYAAGMGAANVASSGSVQQRLGGANGGQGWFNKAAFGLTPVLGSDGKATGYGNSGIGVILGPGQFNWDMSLTKTTKVGGIRENGSLEFRTDFFNAFNHPQFNNPAVLDVSKGTFGQIVSTSVNPRLIQLGLKYIF